MIRQKRIDEITKRYGFTPHTPKTHLVSLNEIECKMNPNNYNSPLKLSKIEMGGLIKLREVYIRNAEAWGITTGYQMDKTLGRNIPYIVLNNEQTIGTQDILKL